MRTEFEFQETDNYQAKISITLSMASWRRLAAAINDGNKTRWSATGEAVLNAITDMMRKVDDTIIDKHGGEKE